MAGHQRQVVGPSSCFKPKYLSNVDGKILTSICKDVGSESYGKFAIEFWESKNNLRDPAQKYKDCWSNIWIMEN